jgi:hypothetical protein
MWAATAGEMSVKAKVIKPLFQLYPDAAVCLLSARGRW